MFSQMKVVAWAAIRCMNSYLKIYDAETRLKFRSENLAIYHQPSLTRGSRSRDRSGCLRLRDTLLSLLFGTLCLLVFLLLLFRFPLRPLLSDGNRVEREVP